MMKKRIKDCATEFTGTGDSRRCDSVDGVAHADGDAHEDVRCDATS